MGRVRIKNLQVGTWFEDISGNIQCVHSKENWLVWTVRVGNIVPGPDDCYASSAVVGN
jgi:hypothetical protein